MKFSEENWIRKSVSFYPKIYLFISGFSLVRDNIWLTLIVANHLSPKKLRECSRIFYIKTSFLVEIKFITDDSEQTHKQILILN